MNLALMVLHQLRLWFENRGRAAGISSLDIPSMETGGDQ
jgi:hypothetical protein